MAPVEHDPEGVAELPPSPSLCVLLFQILRISIFEFRIYPQHAAQPPDAKIHNKPQARPLFQQSPKMARRTQKAAIHPSRLPAHRRTEMEQTLLHLSGSKHSHNTPIKKLLRPPLRQRLFNK